MKRLLALLLILALVGSVSATTLNFQNLGDNSSIESVKYITSASIMSQDWVESTSGGNSYIRLGLSETTGARFMVQFV